MDVTNSLNRPSPVVVGVTGHRILTDIDRIRTGVDHALDHIESAWPGRSLTVLSPLAEGADRIVVDKVLQHPLSQLVVPLPCAVDIYVLDFKSEESKNDFRRLFAMADRVVDPTSAPSRREAFEAVGVYVVDNCDVLIAIWDGKQEQGRGGTAGVVERARRQGKPVVIVRAGNRKPGMEEPTTLGAEQGKVIVERFPKNQ